MKPEAEKEIKRTQIRQADFAKWNGEKFVYGAEARTLRLKCKYYRINDSLFKITEDEQVFVLHDLLWRRTKTDPAEGVLLSEFLDRYSHG